MFFSTFQNAISVVGYIIETVGVVIIIGGVLRSITLMARSFAGQTDAIPFDAVRVEIGRFMLLGLDFLVAGDIIRTVVVDNTVSEILGLGLIVIIRTVLVFTIHLEVEGRWPWQSPPEK
jgi:uncharacterized membrane protein